MQSWDVQALYWMNEHHSPVLDAVLYPVSLLGEKGLLVAMLAYAAFAGAPRGRLKEWATVGLVLMLANRVLLDVIALYGYRLRPFIALNDIRQMGPLWFSSSFPSGHAQYAWLVTILLGAQHPRWLRVLIPFTLITCYSRPYLGMHYPSDVLAGSLMGVLCGFGMLAVRRWWRRRLEAATRYSMGGPEAPASPVTSR